MLDRVEVVTLPYTVKSYNIDYGDYVIVKGCWLKLVDVRSRSIALVKGVNGIEFSKTCSGGVLEAIGPHLLFYRSGSRIHIVNEKCSKLLSIKGKVLMDRNSYGAVLLDKRSKLLVLDVVDGVYIYESAALRTAKSVKLGFNLALIELDGGFGVATPHALNIIPFKGSEVFKPIAHVERNSIIYDGNMLYVVTESGLLEPYAYCSKPRLVPTIYGPIIYCSNGVALGRISEALLELLMEVTARVEGKHVICAPLVYVFRDKSVECIDASKPSLAVHYKPLTNSFFIDMATGAKLNHTINSGSKDSGGGVCDGLRYKASYFVDRRGVKLALTVDYDPYTVISDVVCIDNCRFLGLRGETLIFKIFRPDRGVHIELVRRDCSRVEDVRIKAATQLLSLGYALPFSTKGLSLLVVGGSVLVKRRSGEWGYLDEGVHDANEVEEVYDAGGRLILNYEDYHTPLAWLDYGKGLLLIKAVEARPCRYRVKDSGITVDLANYLCSVRGFRGEWYLVSPINYALKTALKVSARLAKLLKLL